MSPDKHVHKPVRNFMVHLRSNHGDKYRVPKKANNSFKMGYDPEFNTSQELDPDVLTKVLLL